MPEGSPRGATSAGGGAAGEGLVALHVGCWKRYIPGFIHVDLVDLPHIDHQCDVADLSVFPDAYADLLYASHVLEYFDRQEAMAVLQEWRRVLKPGGTLRLAVPDFQALVAVYQDTARLELILGPLYGRMPIDSGDGTRVLYHRTVYDYASLGGLLQDAGFANYRRYDWRQTVHRDYDDHSQAYIPHMDKEHGRLISLNVEVEKA